MKTNPRSAVLAAIVAFILSPTSPVQQLAAQDRTPKTDQTSLTPVDQNSSQSQARALSRAFHEAATRIRSSVVSLHSTRQVLPERNSSTEQIPNLPPGFERFFGDDFFGPDLRQRAPQQGYVQRGAGTGVIVSSDGYIVTNSHVIRDADEIRVRLEDGRNLSATVVGNDARSEIAVIRIDADGLTPAELGDSDELKVGQWVLAVGNPLRLAQTVTAGIVSAKGRSNIGITDYENFIQTDAAINPGNSGGPLIDLNGRVVGINTAIATRTGGYMGIGFAIPSKMVQRVMNQLIEHGHVARGLLGVIIQPLVPDLAESFGFTGKDGVLVADVSPDGPAAKAGLQSGDIITTLNGRTVTSTAEVRNTVAEFRPGTIVTIAYFRDGRRQQVEVKLAALDGTTSDVDGESPPPAPSVNDLKLGMKLQNATPDVMKQLGNNPETSGVLIVQTTPGGAAENAGLQTADVIIAVNGKRVSSEESFRDQVLQANSSGVRLLILRQGRRTFVFLKIPAENDSAVSRQ